VSGPKFPLFVRLRVWLLRALVGLMPAAVVRQAAYRVWERAHEDDPLTAAENKYRATPKMLDWARVSRHDEESERP